jgi:beta-N-acetylglucosaminidase
MVKSTKKKIITTCIMLVMALMGVTIFQYSKIMAYTEKSGTINGTYVNVRTSAGTAGNTNKLTYNGKYVQLNVGNSVTIVGEDNASDGALWYKVKFNYTNGVELTGYVHSAYVDISNVSYTPDTDFEKYLSEQGFPESYKVKLRQLHAKYPNWVFVADNLSYDWNTVVTNESVLGRSLVSKNSISSWKSLAQGSYNWETGQWATFDGGAWVAASEELVAYCMDPRNFLDDNYIFMFEMLSFNSSIHKQSNVESLLSGSFMSNAYIEGSKTYATAFMEAAAQSGVSPYHLASRVIQEVGSNGNSGSISGYYAPSTGNVYNSIYNFYNIGAYAASGRGAVENGLIYASKTDSATMRPWNTKYKALVGGALYIGNGYINVGQDTLYYEKFDFVGTPYIHQYMTNILAPKSEALKMSNAYSTSMKQTVALVFKIPVFKNMPSEACACPTVDGSPNNILENITVDGYSLTPTFSKFTQEYDLIVPNSVDSIKVSATAIDSQATISGTGKISLKVGKNEVNVVVTAKNGDKRTYSVNVVREAANNTSTTQPTTTQQTTTQQTTTQQTTTQQTTTQQTTTQQTTTQQTTTQQTTPQQTTTNKTSAIATYKTTYPILNNDYITGISVGTSADTLKKKFTLSNCNINVYNSDGKTKNNGLMCTGNKVVITDNSGKTIKEYTCVIYGDVNGDGVISILDMLHQKRDILGISKLSGAKAIAADVNKKDGINLLDMLYVKRQILGIANISQ